MARLAMSTGIWPATMGSVVTSAGTPVAEVDLALELVSTSTRPLDRYGVPSQLFGASGRTDEDGRFQVAAQPGQYRATAVPPEQLGHPRTTVDLEVGRGMVEGFTVELPDAGVVSGRVLDDLNEPLAGATVQAFAVAGIEGRGRPRRTPTSRCRLTCARCRWTVRRHERLGSQQ